MLAAPCNAAAVEEDCQVFVILEEAFVHLPFIQAVPTEDIGV